MFLASWYWRKKKESGWTVKKAILLGLEGSSSYTILKNVVTPPNNHSDRSCRQIVDKSETQHYMDNLDE